MSYLLSPSGGYAGSPIANTKRALQLGLNPSSCSRFAGGEIDIRTPDVSLDLRKWAGVVYFFPDLSNDR